MIVCEDGTPIFGTDDAREYLACHGVSNHHIDDFAALLNCEENIEMARALVDSDLVAYEVQYDEICCIVDDIASSIDAALSKSRITGARDLLAWIRDTLVEMTGR